MKPSRVITGTFMAMIATQAVGSIDQKHRLPAPKQFAAIATLWGILFLLIDTGLGRLAARLSILVLVTGMVVGPFGTTAIRFLNTVTDKFAIAPPPEETQIPHDLIVNPTSQNRQRII
jgi:hypothetical protein